MTRERVVYVNGEIVPESKAKVSIGDFGFLFVKVGTLLLVRAKTLF